MNRVFDFVRDLAEADPIVLIALGAAALTVTAIILYRRATRAKRLKADARIVRARR